ncbi:hypothetical protein C7R88_03625 [Plesiomonas shigelloides]|uniref:hypothetical protein n=1 Tax=Plesiomonas shigelloides TaxID=703 RepID=UPI000D13479A|nr:hypothetical protein [Plesiomonas shigelloides]AVQ86481.1 hypothetical protein C7R88_03625 [Plesiomonas shigelloides]
MLIARVVENIRDTYDKFDSAYTNSSRIFNFVSRFKVNGRNNPIAQIVSSVFSTDQHTVFLLSVSFFSMVVLMYTIDKQGLAYNIFLSVLAACIFDFVVNRIRKERSKELIAVSLTPIMHRIIMRKHAILCAIDESLFRKYFDSGNAQVLYENIKSSNQHQVFNNGIHVDGSELLTSTRNSLRRDLTLQEFIGVHLKLLARDVEYALAVSDIKEFDDLYISLTLLRNNFDIYDLNRNEQAAFEIANLSDSYSRFQLVTGFILPTQDIEYWFFRKMKKYFPSEVALYPRFSKLACRKARTHDQACIRELGGF